MTSQPELSAEAVRDAALAGLELLEQAIPMTRTMRLRIQVLEGLLQQLATGETILAPATKPAATADDG